MNVMRTIQKGEQQPWIDSLFGIPYPPSASWQPGTPPTFPLPFELQQPVQGGYLYVVYDGAVIGYGKIGRVFHHHGEQVGTHAQAVKPGHAIEVSGTLTRMPFTITKTGFTGVRYVQQDLHLLPQATAQQIVDSL